MLIGGHVSAAMWISFSLPSVDRAVVPAALCEAQLAADGGLAGIATTSIPTHRLRNDAIHDPG
jgi:hypothetical protein